jgi:hypothetical protein
LCRGERRAAIGNRVDPAGQSQIRRRVFRNNSQIPSLQPLLKIRSWYILTTVRSGRARGSAFPKAFTQVTPSYEIKNVLRLIGKASGTLNQCQPAEDFILPNDGTTPRSSRRFAQQTLRQMSCWQIYAPEPRGAFCKRSTASCNERLSVGAEGCRVDQVVVLHRRTPRDASFCFPELRSLV